MTLEEVRDNLSEDQIYFINQSADFWRYDIGVNVIPADTRNKLPILTGPNIKTSLFLNGSMKNGI